MINFLRILLLCILAPLFLLCCVVVHLLWRLFTLPTRILGKGR